MAKKFTTAQIQEQGRQIAEDITEKTKNTRRKEMLPISSIVFNPDNEFRDEDTAESIEELAQDIKEHGLYHDILVCKQSDGTYLLISGERRVRACQFIGMTTISATVEEGLSRDEMLTQLYAANLNVRHISTERRIAYIQSLREKVSDQYKDKIKDTISSMMNIDERQARKLINISTGLIPELAQFLYDEYLTINEAASFSSLPESAQHALTELFSRAVSSGADRNRAKTVALDFTKKVKAVCSSNKKAYSRLDVEEQKSSNALTAAQKDLQSKSPEKREIAKITVQKQQNTLENIRLSREELEQKQKARFTALQREMMDALADTSVPETPQITSVGAEKALRKIERALKAAEEYLTPHENEILQNAMRQITEEREKVC